MVKRYIFVTVTHSNRALKCRNVKLDMEMTVHDLKLKLFSLISTSPPNMRLMLQDEHGSNVCLISDDEEIIGSYSPYDGCIIHVIDLDPHSLVNQGWLDDISQIKKYVMSEADYNKRENTFRKFRQQQRWTSLSAHGRNVCTVDAGIDRLELSTQLLSDLESAVVTSRRCTVQPGSRDGTVRYVGEVQGADPGVWVGVELDDPYGEHDGSLEGRRYFQATHGHGAFIRPVLIDLHAVVKNYVLSPEDEI
ncbi:hypothetical protein CEUSTIGMA_g9670.t1 [Chlamydomonas eustigma]|uniref:CAP-Gly domain-containing protein n=1 Tax=Chlamydomonas eustigma TaxID=1157962 RepID=A0A250XH46_9CHLO|nr:hypothetical protein CEUSTIGMA_g9670.t1 [Chlamydomonas eustigma]|eukprot:GAX82242.1 hypothetical protein CEUSTIGMA_g9670.t1 [Chlamydomonas eustigma]